MILNANHLIGVYIRRVFRETSFGANYKYLCNLIFWTSVTSLQTTVEGLVQKYFPAWSLRHTLHAGLTAIMKCGKRNDICLVVFPKQYMQ